MIPFNIGLDMGVAHWLYGGQWCSVPGCESNVPCSNWKMADQWFNKYQNNVQRLINILWTTEQHNIYGFLWVRPGPVGGLLMQVQGEAGSHDLSVNEDWRLQTTAQGIGIYPMVLACECVDCGVKSTQIWRVVPFSLSAFAFPTTSKLNFPAE